MESLSAEIKSAARKNGITESLKITSDLKQRNSILELASNAWVDLQNELLNNPFHEGNTIAKIMSVLQFSTDAEKSLPPYGIIIQISILQKS